MTLSWLPVIWTDSIGSILILVLAALCTAFSRRLVTRGREEETFFRYLFLLSLTFVFFAISRSFGHLVKHVLFYFNQQHVWQHIAPFSGAVNTAAFIVIFSFGIYFHRSRKIYSELERHKNHLSALVDERTAKLKKTINEFSAVMDAIDYGILFMDDRLRLRIANRAFREIWGVPESFISSHPNLRQLMEFNRYNNIYDVAEEKFDCYMQQRERDIRNGTILPTDLARRDGKIIQYQCIELPDGWRMLTYLDITELKKTQDKLIRSQKMEAIGMMASGVAHDLNNILSGVVSYPDLLLMQLPGDSELRRPLEAIQQSGRRAAEVVADLLTVARGVAGRRETHSLHTLINEYLTSPEGVKMLSHYPEIRIKTDFTSESANISCSPVHIKKCLMNLLVNAAESISGAGSIWIETRVDEVTIPLPGQESTQPGKYAVLLVRDTGKGISKKDIKHIFEPFYSKKIMGRSGTGLGLTIVWNTVQEHGGGVTVTGNDPGTCFALYFPLVDEEPAGQEEVTGAAGLRGRGESILVVDDEPQLRDIAAKMLSSLDYCVDTASSGEEAVERVKAKAMDLLVLDMLMEPGINGRETLERIIALYPEQRAIIVSGFSENEEVRKARELTDIIFIRKPFTLVELGTAVRNRLQG